MSNTTFSQYIAQLKERRPEIAEFLLRCERNHIVREDIVAMGHSLRHLVALTQDRNGRLHMLAMTMQQAIAPEANKSAEELTLLCKKLLTACHDALVMTQATEEPLQVYAPNVTLRGKRLTLLSVDDDRIIHHMMLNMFGEHLDVLTASDGVEGLAMMRSHKPDLVLLDDAMPKMTGMKLVETAKADPALAYIPVIMLTSSDRPEDIARATAAGAADYVIKPFNPQSLADAIYRVLGAH